MLPQGTRIRQVFMAQAGLHPAWGALAGLTYFFSYIPLKLFAPRYPTFPFLLLVILVFSVARYRLVCVCDDAIYVFRSRMLSPSTPREILGSEPRERVLGPMSGLWGTTEILAEKHYVSRRFHKDVEAADAAGTQAGGG